MKPFETAFPGRCGVCDGKIPTGSEAIYVDDELAHVACPAPAAIIAPCPDCFMTPAVNGTCGCDE